MREGELINQTANKIKKYLHVPGTIIGACKGMDTEYVYAECTMSLHYHGRPVSEIALRKMGIII